MTRMSSKPIAKSAAQPREFAAHFHLMGCVDFDDCQSLQRRLAYDALTRGDGRIAVLICEHPPLVTIGRAGSRAHVRLTGVELAERQLTVRYVSRGGGAILHGPGQLAIYPIVSLDWHGWTVGEYLRRLQASLQDTLCDRRIKTEAKPGCHSLAGRTGVLAAIGVSVRHGVTLQGAFIGVNPDMRDYARVDVSHGQTMSSILSEQPAPVRMTAVRAALVTHLATAFGCERHHLHTGHPHLPDLPLSDAREHAA
jgi:lipoyl(octanoyl) transferase